MASSSANKLPSFDGKGDVMAFLMKMSLHIRLKKVTGEEAAMLLASRLEEPAFTVYMRMPDTDKSDIKKIEAALKKQYETGDRDREQALSLLNARLLKEGESLEDFAFAISRLVKLAYPTFSLTDQNIHEKDAFVGGLHPDLQMNLKTLPDFKTMTYKLVVDNAIRFQVAGVKSCMKKNVDTVNKIQEATHSVLPTASNELETRMNSLEGLVAQISNFGLGNRGRNRGRGRGRYRGRGNGSNNERHCWNCSSQSHVVRQCPNRFCQSCGGRGHDAWQTSCPNHS